MPKGSPSSRSGQLSRLSSLTKRVTLTNPVRGRRDGINEGEWRPPPTQSEPRRGSLSFPNLDPHKTWDVRLENRNISENICTSGLTHITDMPRSANIRLATVRNHNGTEKQGLNDRFSHLRLRSIPRGRVSKIQALGNRRTFVTVAASRGPAIPFLRLSGKPSPRGKPDSHDDLVSHLITAMIH